jgi:hypothetical protein
MDVYSFLDLAIEDSEDCKIWSLEQDTFVFEGTIKEAKNKYESKYEDVCSWEISDGVILININ